MSFINPWLDWKNSSWPTLNFLQDDVFTFTGSLNSQTVPTTCESCSGAWVQQDADIPLTSGGVCSCCCKDWNLLQGQELVSRFAERVDVREGSRREVRDKDQQSLPLFPAAHPSANKNSRLRVRKNGLCCCSNLSSELPSLWLVAW